MIKITLHTSLKMGFFISSLLFIMVSCEDVYYQDMSDVVDEEAVDLEIVIFGGVTSEKRYQEITLTKPMSLYDEGFDSISGAIVKLKIGTDYYDFIEEVNHANVQAAIKRKGVYLSVDSIQGIPGEAHTLIVDYDGKNYTASDTMVAVIPFEFSDIILPVIVSEGRPDTLGNFVAPRLSLKLIHFGAYNTNIFNWHSIDSTQDNAYHHNASVYDFGNVDQQGLLSEMYDAQGNPLNFRTTQLVTVKKLSVSQQYEDYLIDVFKETFWDTNIFSTTPANVPTNVSEGGSGFFYASDVAVKSMDGIDFLDLLE